MKKIVYFILSRCFGKKRFYRFFLILKNIAIQGLNYRNTDIEKNGEHYLINLIFNYYKSTSEQLIIFDVGANVGNYSKVVAERFESKATIYAFEPFSVPFKKLQELQKTNPTIKPYPIGFSDKNEALIIHTSNEFSEIGGIYNRSFIFQDIPHDQQEMCNFKTLDEFCNETKIAQIHFLKIDVEGHELAVLNGSKTLLNNSKIDIIQFEFGAGNHFSRTYFIDFYHLLEKNYAIYRLLADGLIEISDYNSELEMQILTYYVAINKKIVKTIIAQNGF